MLAKAVEDIGVEPCSDSAKRKLSSKKKGVNHFLAGQDYDERNTNNTTATVIEMRDVIDNLEAEIRQIKSEQEKRNRLIELMLEDGKRRFDWE
ncbi:hypothetical protein [Idiomarina sp.]|uniref:hypothetical protein n=1 Tax=Idiomarina sp. TaxID=1874361 RepID=UPI003518E2CA